MRTFRAVPGKGIVASRKITASGKSDTEAMLQKVAENYVLMALEFDMDSHSYDLNTPEQATNAALRLFKRYLDEEGPEYLGLPSDFKLTKEIGSILKPMMLAEAEQYDYGDDSEFDDWDY